MNIALEKTEEYVNGSKRRTYGDAFVRGNNGTLSTFVSFSRWLLILFVVMYISAD